MLTEVRFGTELVFEDASGAELLLTTALGEQWGAWVGTSLEAVLGEGGLKLEVDGELVGFSSGEAPLGFGVIPSDDFPLTIELEGTCVYQIGRSPVSGAFDCSDYAMVQSDLVIGGVTIGTGESAAVDGFTVFNHQVAYRDPSYEEYNCADRGPSPVDIEVVATRESPGLCGDYAPPPPVDPTCTADETCEGGRSCSRPHDPRCGACVRLETTCGDDVDCPGSDVCVPISHPCACEGPGPVRACEAACSGDSCGDGSTCEGGHCIEISCTDGYECPPNFDCFDGLAIGIPHGCVRRDCSASSDCDCGACVGGECSSGPGSCRLPSA